MAEKIKICCVDKIYVKGICFEKNKTAPECEIEKLIPDMAYVNVVDCDAKLFAVKSVIGKEPHPFITMCEAARYRDGTWIVGIDVRQNRYFTPVFTNEDENS